MDFIKQLLISAILQGDIDITLSADVAPLAQIIQENCVLALYRIKKILEDDRLDDKECFERIEEIVTIFEELGSNCGNRHDFG